MVYKDSSAMKIPKTIPLVVAALYSLEAVWSELVEGYGKTEVLVTSLYSITLAKLGIVAMIFELVDFFQE